MRRAELEPPAGDDPLWYKEAVVYEVHVRAFADSNGDGIGDLPGLTGKLDYLYDLGVNLLWLLPFYPSPLRDGGYDVADYREINPIYGTLVDFRALLQEAHRRGIRVITDLVLNHTSDQHPWFQRARSARPGTRARDFYVWSDTPERYREARIIFKDFESSNWAWDPVAGAYYWHRFYSHQPDLNFDNPEVRRTMLGVVDFWLGMGVDGLRLDAAPYLFERPGTTCESLPETLAYLRELRAHVDERFPDRVLLAEANQRPGDAVAYFGRGDICHLAFHFPLVPRLFMAARIEDSAPIVDVISRTPAIPVNAQWALFLRNHDELTLEMVGDEERDAMYRMYAQDPRARINLGIRRRLAPLLGNNRKLIELMSGLLLSLPGTPVLYYGDEIGMGDDIGFPDRDGVRAPMQWSADPNAGFSRADPLRPDLPFVTDPEYHYRTLNVEAQLRDPDSLLRWMKSLIALRKRYRVFGRGSMEFLDPENRRVLVFLRRHEDEQVLVAANLSGTEQHVGIDRPNLRGLAPVDLIGETESPPIGDAPYSITLGSREFRWVLLRQAAAGTRARSRPLRLDSPARREHQSSPRKAGALTGSLRAMARKYGVQTSFTDVYGVRRPASPSGLEAVLRALGAPLGEPSATTEPRELLDPVVVAWDGKLREVPVRAWEPLGPCSVQVRLEDGGAVPARIQPTPDGMHAVRVCASLIPGYHRLSIDGADWQAESLVISAPRRCPSPARPTWGVFLPLYSLRARGDVGIGSFENLAELHEWMRRLGGTVVGTLPLFAQFLHQPFEPSPYSPASRLFWNELFIAIEGVPEASASTEAVDMAAALDRRRLGRGRLVDYRAVRMAKQPVLEALARAFFSDGSTNRRRAFEAYRQARPELDDYARFRAFGERTGRPWPAWPAPQREGKISDRDVDPHRVAYHSYVQWVADQQLGAIARDSNEPGRGLYLDLPLGVNPASYDTWRHRDVFAQGVSGGAPPDSFFPLGQDWGFPPLNPVRIREDGYAYVRASLRQVLRHAGGIRIDHMMGFHRLYWVPTGLDPSQGAYVRYPAEELYAVLALEASKAGAAVIGEDLGTVPRAVRAAMRRHGVMRSHVVQLDASPEQEHPLAPAPDDSVASVNTHDLPTFAAFWGGLDIEDRLEQGLFDACEARELRHERNRLRRALVRQLRVEGWLADRDGTDPASVFRALLQHLATGSAQVLVVNLEDLWLETEPQNRPGTGPEQPNWRLRAARTLEEFGRDALVLSTLEGVHNLRHALGDPEST